MTDDLQLVRYHYRVNPADAEPSTRQSHERWFRRVVESGGLVVAGRVEEDGLPSALLLIRCSTQAEARNVVADDPYVQQGLVEVSVAAFSARHLPLLDVAADSLGTEVPVDVDPRVRAVLAGYCRGVDIPDLRLVRATFHDDAVCDYGAFQGGREDVVAQVQEVHARADFVASRHLLADLTTAVADRAGVEIESSFVSRRLERRGDSFLMRTREGRYLDRFEARAGDLRVVHRRVVDDWVVEQHVELTGPPSLLGGPRE